MKSISNRVEQLEKAADKDTPEEPVELVIREWLMSAEFDADGERLPNVLLSETRSVF
jgi:hypothetical protein